LLHDAPLNRKTLMGTRNGGDKGNDARECGSKMLPVRNMCAKISHEKTRVGSGTKLMRQR